MDDYIVWTPRLTVNVDLIDDQHKELYSRMNRLIQAVLSGSGKDEVERMLSFLAEYTVFHFSEEERYMQRYRFPGYDTHRRAHVTLVEQVQNMGEQVRADGYSSELVTSVVTQLGDWISHHIQKMDMEMGRYLKDKV
jgi:hemerythrin